MCKKRKELDILGAGAYDNGELIGLAGCSADCAEMYQIGVDVLPDYRRQGVAAALTSRLALEILSLEKVPFYCAAWCNLKSVPNAIKCGFRPAWVELTAREAAFVDGINRKNGRGILDFRKRWERSAVKARRLLRSSLARSGAFLTKPEP